MKGMPGRGLWLLSLIACLCIVGVLASAEERVQYGKTIGADACIYAKPDERAEVLLVVKNVETPFQLFAEVDGWFAVTLADGTIGYIASESIGEIDEATFLALAGDKLMVWVPVHGGKKYHKHAECSNMIEPEYVAVSVAKDRGFTSCGRCKPGE